MQALRAPEAPPLVPVSICRPEDRRYLLLAAILASALGFIDGSVVAIAMPAMRAGLSASLSQAQWIGAGYLLALSSLVLTGGAMGDRFGVARVFGLGIAVFVLASLICTVAGSAEAMIAARIVQGLGAGLMVPGSMALISRAYPAGERGRALGIWAAAASGTTVAGPILGGLVLSSGAEDAWRWIFALNLPLGGVALWLLWSKTVPDPGRPGTPVDWPGAILASTALAILAWDLTEGGGSAWSLVALGLSGLFLWHEARTPAPMLPLSMFRNRAFSAANLATLFLFFALAAVLFYLPMTAVTAWGARGIDVTLALLPLGILIGVFSTPAGRLVDRIGPGYVVTTGALLVSIAYAGLALSAAQAGMYTHILPLMALNGLGMSLVAAPISAAVMASAGEGEQGAASGINNAVARVANLVAVTLMGGVAAGAYRAAGGPGSFAETGLADPVHIAATAAGFATVATIASVAALVASAISAFGIRRQEMARR
jgi:EmrB/QacA subfamily drug resistance transporter